MTQRAAYSPAPCAAGRIRLAHGLIKTIGSLRYRPAALDQPPILRRDGGRRRVRLRDVRRPRYPRRPHPRRVRPGQTYSRTDLGVRGSHNDVITTVTNKDRLRRRGLLSRQTWMRSSSGCALIPPPPSTATIPLLDNPRSLRPIGGVRQMTWHARIWVDQNRGNTFSV
jgi:hypothetical protein